MIFSVHGAVVQHYGVIEADNYHAEWALYWTDLIKTGTLRLPFGTGKHAPIAAEDQSGRFSQWD
jgi:hypothetical protein